MATNNSDTSFLDNAKEYAGNVYNQTKDEFSRVSQNSKDRDWIVERESKLNNLTLSQKEQLKYISSADDAMKFVEAATAGDRQGAENLYNDALKSQGGAIASFAGDVATTALGGAAGKAAFKVAPKLFKGAAEVIGENIPSLKKVSNVFKSSADKADEALAAERAARAAAREQRAQESIQRAQTEQQQARTARTSTPAETETPFRSNTTRATETVQETITPMPEQSIFSQAADWAKNKIGQGADWAGGKVVEGAKSVGSGIASLGKTVLKGAGLGAAIGIPAGEYFENLSDEEKAKIQEQAQKGVDWVDNAIDQPEDLWNNIKEGAGSLLGDAAAGALGATVGKGSSPFSGISSGMGSLFAGGGSIGASLNSMPSGGDSGRIGESQFGGGDVQGKSAIEVLNKIYNILAKTNDTINSISRDVSALTRSQSQQDASNDLNSANMRARQNEMGIATATPMYGGGGGGRNLESGQESEADSGFWSKLLSTGKKVNPKAAAAAAASALNPVKKAKTGVGLAKKLWDTGKKLAKPAAQIGATVVGAELLKDDGKSGGKYQDHYNKVYEMAYKEAKERGLENPEAQAHLAAAQSVEETGGGTSATARKNNAMFGIKKTQEGQGTAAGTGLVWSPEEENGKKFMKKSEFRGYATPEDSVKDRFDFIKTKRYAKVRAAASAEQAIEEMGKSGYAGDSGYTGKLSKLYNQYGQHVGKPKTVSGEEEKSSPYDVPVDKESSMPASMPESMEAFKAALLENDANQKAAEEERLKIVNAPEDPSETAYEHMHKLSVATDKVDALGNFKMGIINDEKYKDSKDFLDSKNRNDVYNFYKDPDYFKKNNLSEKQTKKSQLQKDVDKTAETYVAANPTASFVTPREEQYQEQTDKDNGKTATPVTPYSNIPDSEKLDAPKFNLYKDSMGIMQKQDLETGEEFLATDDDIKQDKKQKEHEAQWVEQHKTNSSLSNLEKEKQAKLQAIGARRGKEGEDNAVLDAEGEKVLDEFHAKKQAATASPVKNDDTKKQIAEIDRQKATLETERTQISQSGVNVDKETMDKQLDRLSDIHTEMSSLNEQRNNLAGNQNGQTAPKPAAATQQQAQQTPPPSAPAGVGKSVPSVRNDDPTIKMMEEGSMWSTQGA